MSRFDSIYLLSPEAAPGFLHSLAASGVAAAYPAQPGAAAPSLPLRVQDGVGIITIRGALDSQTRVSWWGETLSTGYDAIAEALALAQANPAVLSILLSLDSPGGSVGGCRELATLISQSRKPVAAYADGLCASAAYWLASSTGRVFAPATALVGSIGVIMAHVDYSRLNEKAGIQVTYITGGEWKATGNADEPLSPEALAYLKERVNGLHAIFRADVAAWMGLSPEAAANPAAWGDGQLFLASDAARLGLVTHIVSGLDEAVKKFAQETVMDKATLAAQHPELLEQIEKDAREAASAETSRASEKAAAAVRDEMLSLVRAALGEDAEQKMKALVEAGVTASQLAALAPFFGAAQASANAAPSSPSRSAILDAINAATPAPLPQGGPAKQDEARAAIERMAAMGVTK